MAQIPVSIAVSPSGSTLLAAQQVTNTAATVVFNEVVTLGDSASGNVGSVLASGAHLVEPGGVNTQPISASSLPLGLGAGTIGYNQVTVTSATGGTSIVGARATRKALVVVVLTNSANSIYWGDVNVSQTTGVPVLIGQSVSIPTVAAVYGISAGTTTSAVIAYAELYG